MYLCLKLLFVNVLVIIYMKKEGIDMRELLLLLLLQLKVSIEIIVHTEICICKFHILASVQPYYLSFEAIKTIILHMSLARDYSNFDL